MRDILQYFDLLVKTIELGPASSPELELEQRGHKRGVVDGVIYFADGSRLEFTERVVIENARPIKRDYRYQFVQSQTTIFRYDNAPHHPQLKTFPHHKHLGRKTIESEEPDLKQVLQEVAGLLPPEAETSSTSSARKRGRAKNKSPKPKSPTKSQK